MRSRSPVPEEHLRPDRQGDRRADAT